MARRVPTAFGLGPCDGPRDRRSSGGQDGELAILRRRTEIRTATKRPVSAPIRTAQSAAWVRNIFEIAGYVFGPVLVGVLGDHATGAVGSIGDSVSLLMVLWLPGIWIVVRYLPETRGRELEEITG